MEKGCVYVAHANDTDLYKIGITSQSPRKRISSINTSCPYEVSLLCYAEMEGYKSMEEALHNAMEPKCTSGEWFELDETDVFEVVSRLRKNNRLYVSMEFWDSADAFRSSWFSTVEAETASILASFMNEIAHDGEEKAVEILKMIRDSDAPCKYAIDKAEEALSKHSSNDSTKQ